MRLGHPDIFDGDRYIVELVRRHQRRLGRRIRVVDLASGSGFLSRMLAGEIADIDVIANEVEPNLVALARQRLADSRVEIFAAPFIELDREVDILISWGSHYHLSGDYVDHARRLLGGGGVLILGDEFCPEYCNKEDLQRIAAAEFIQVHGGYVITNLTELNAFRHERRVPQACLHMEGRRQRALWTWYKHVIDQAFRFDDMLVVMAELQTALDDLTTSLPGEHKLSPAIVERDFELRGFKQRSKKSIGSWRPELQSFFIYEYVL
jgi:SAM-dependent methyltransferase